MKYETEQLQGIRADKPLIKNTIVERLFLSVATDNQMRNFVKEAHSGATHRATAYASKVVEVWWNHDRERDDRQGIDREDKAFILFERKK